MNFEKVLPVIADFLNNIFFSKIKPGDKFRKHEKGFSIIEAIFAAAFFVIALVPIMGIAALSFDVAARIRDNMVASNLVQEGLEVVRGLRDSNWFIPGRSFGTGMVGSWLVEWNSDWLSQPPQAAASIATSPFLRINTSGVYNYASGTSTKYRRVVTVTEVVPDIELKAVSMVIWPIHRGTTPPGCPSGFDCVQAELRLFNWK